jgi:hypothetical protein
MKKGRRFAAAVAVSSLLAVGSSFPGATVTAYAAGPGSPTTTNLTAFCSELGEYIARLQALKDGPVRNFLLRVALAIQAKYC